MFVYDMYDNNGTKPLLPIEVSYIVEDLFDKEQMTSNVQIRRFALCVAHPPAQFIHAFNNCF